MDMTMIVLRQTLVMGLYMAIGYVLFKGKKLSLDGSRSLATLLIWLIVPCVIVRSFCVEPTPERVRMLGESFVLSTIAVALSLIICLLLLKKKPLECFAVTFSNAGFFGVPLVSAAVGEDAVFFLCWLLVWVNLLQWTWGAAVMQHKPISVKLSELLRNPFVIATLLGMVLFFTGLGARLPSVISTAMAGVSALNGPLAMMVLGVYLAQTRLVKLFTTPRLYLISAIRLWLIPLVTLAVFALIPMDARMKLTVLIAAAAPIGANAAVYAQLYDSDYPYACQMVALCTAVAIGMLPLFIMLAVKVL